MLSKRFSILVAAAGALPAAGQTPPTPSAPTAGPSATLSSFWWGDYDGDGLLDAYALEAGGVGRLLRNLGDGTFEPTTDVAGLAAAAGVTSAGWADHDGDGRLDLYLGAASGAGRLYRNLGDGTFLDVTVGSGLDHEGTAQSVEWLDYDADGRPDLAVRTALERRLYHNLGGGLFEAVELGLGAPAPLATSFVAPADVASAAASGPGAPGNGSSARAATGVGQPLLAGGAGVSVGGVQRLPGGTVEGSGAGFCADGLFDQTLPGNCVQAASDPTLGMLYPLGTEFCIDPANDFVGMGTVAPTANLHVRANSGVLSRMLIDKPGGAQLELTSFNSTASVGTSNGHDLRLVADGLIRMTVATSGNVGIGDVTPDGRLEVRSSGTGDILNLYDSTTNVMTVVDGGRVGIGVSAPTARLQVHEGSVAAAVHGTNASTGRAALFENTGAGNTAPAVEINHGGLGIGLVSTNTLTGGAGRFTNTLSTNTASALSADHDGAGSAIFASQSSTTSLSPAVDVRGFSNNAMALRVISNNSGDAGEFFCNDTAGTGRGVDVRVRGTGNGVHSLAEGGGFGGYFETNFVSGATALAANSVVNLGDIFTASNGTDVEFRVESSGNVFCDGAFTGGGADYAEWLQRADLEEEIGPGDVVGVRGGRVSKRLAGAQQLMVVSTDPALVGNGADADQSEREGFEMVAFIGQVPVKVRGAVAVGDFVLPSGGDDGTARAVAPARIAAADLALVIGRAWEAAEGEGLHLVNVVVGVDQAAAAAIAIESLQRDLVSRERELDGLTTRLALVEEALGLATDPLARRD